MFTGVRDHSGLHSGVNALQLELYESAEAHCSFHGRNRYPFHRIFAVRDSGGKSWIHSHSLDKRLVMRPGCVYFMSEGSDLEFEFHYDMFLYSFHFTLNLCGRNLFSVPFLMEEHSGREAFITEIPALMTPEPGGFEFCMLQSLLLKEVSDFLKPCPRILLNPEDFQNVFEYIRRNIRAGIPIEELASLTELSPDSFSRRFSQKIGIPVKQYLNRELARKAGVLLQTSKLKIKEIAFELGFFDEYYFSRFFHKETGSTPSEFRARVTPR